MREVLERFRCGGCGSALFELWNSSKEGLLLKCPDCLSVSIIKTISKIEILHKEGDGTPAIF